MNILDQIADSNRTRVAEAKKTLPLEEVRREAEELGGGNEFPFEKKLADEEITYICEVKKASPSKGVIAEIFEPVEIAKEYERIGAGAISVLTEPKWFMGSMDILRSIRSEVSIPLLRKDFTIDEYMIYEAKAAGADIILLICAILDEGELKSYRELADELGLSAIVEAHDEAEIEKGLRAGARIIGVNNRNLKDFTVDVGNGIRLRERVPDDVYFIAESGIKTHEDIHRLKQGKVNGVLIGETLMRADDKEKMLNELRGWKN